MNVWIGSSDSFTTTAFWTDGVPTSDDTLVFTGPTSPPPSPPLPPWVPPPPPPPYSQQSVTFPTTADLSYAAIQFKDGYTGTVTFPANISFGGYNQTCGATAQSADKTLTVTTSFEWTGGVWNNTTNLATYKLMAPGNIGTDTTSLSCGSKIVLDGTGDLAAYVNQAGVLNLGNGGGITVLEGGTYNMQQINVPVPTGGAEPKIDNDGNMTLVKGSVNIKHGTLKSVLINGGTLFVQEDGAEVTGTIPGSIWGVHATTLDSKIVIRNGFTLKAAYDVYLEKGEMYTLAAPANGTQIATIDGGFYMNGGKLDLGRGNGTSAADYSVLVVLVSAHLTGGTFATKLNANNTAQRDFISTGNMFYTYPDFKIEAIIHEGTGASGMKWDVLVSVNGFYNDIDDDPGLIHPLIYAWGRRVGEKIGYVEFK